MLAAILFLCGTINVWAQSANNIPADIDAADATIIEMGKAKGTSHLGQNRKCRHQRRWKHFCKRRDGSGGHDP